MERLPIQSANIASLGYDAETQTLEVEFLNGHVFQYFNVPADIYNGFLEAESKGLYFSISIKGYYGYVKL
jgi:hypothetical protein